MRGDFEALRDPRLELRTRETERGDPFPFGLPRVEPFFDAGRAMAAALPRRFVGVSGRETTSRLAGDLVGDFLAGDFLAGDDFLAGEDFLTSTICDVVLQQKPKMTKTATAATKWRAEARRTLGTGQ